MRVMLISLMLFLSSCAAPKKRSFDAEWQFCNAVDGTPMACLTLADTIKLRRVLSEGCR